MPRCRFDLCAVAGILSLSLLAPAGWAQNQAPKPAPPPPTINPDTQAAIAAQAGQAAQPPQTPPKTGPDYPDPRSLEIGAFYFVPLGTTGPSIYGGSQASALLEYETLTNLGKPRRGPGLEASIPITRTGAIHVELFRIEGTGNENAPAATTVFTTPISKGDYLATQYKVTGGKIYLDDLLFPHKFPVARFRLKSLWEFQYLSIGSNINAPFVTTSIESASGTKSVILPSFGLAAEYAIAPHVLLRADASGFGIPHHSNIWDANATIAWRVGSIEVVGGAKAVHGKTTPNSTEYVSVTLSGVFVGVRWYTPFFSR